MNAQQVRRLCETLALGRALSKPAPVTGGLLHQMWRLETERGAYAVKQLTPRLLDIAGAAHYALSEEIAARAAERGVSVPLALCTAGSPVVPVGGSEQLSVIVHPWIEGEMLTGPAGPERAARIGELLARIHAIAPDGLSQALDPWAPAVIQTDDLLLDTRWGAELGLAWAADARRLHRDMVLTYGRYRQALPDLYRHQTLGHRDLDQKNVLWREDGTPVVLDWEAAGMTNPALELADAALTWAGIAAGEPVKDSVHALVAAYRDAGGVLSDEARDVFYGVAAHWMVWLRAMMRQAVDTREALQASMEDPDDDLGYFPIPTITPARKRALKREHTVANDEVARSLAAIERLLANLDLYASWLSG
jgi:thiamine kinase-like enzyme